MSLVDVFGGVLLGSYQNSAAGPPPYTVDVPHPFTYPEEMPFSPYTMYTDDPQRPEHVPVPETEPETAPVRPGHEHEPHPLRTKRLEISHQAESNQSHKTHLQHTNQPESNLQRGSKIESHSSLDHKIHSQPGQNHSQIHHHYKDPLLHPVPHRHLRKFRVRMPSRTPLNVRRIFTFLNMRITQKLLFENLHLVRKKAASG